MARQNLISATLDSAIATTVLLGLSDGTPKALPFARRFKGQSKNSNS